jgi:hypothetical protein
LTNYRGGSLCQIHENVFGNRCHVRDCIGTVVAATLACATHQALWKKHKLDHSSGSLAGSKRMLNRHQENLPWNERNGHEHQAHDQPAPEPRMLKHFFSPATFYCVETICAPCGVVIVWAKFAKSESESNILGPVWIPGILLSRLPNQRFDGSFGIGNRIPREKAKLKPRRCLVALGFGFLCDTFLYTTASRHCVTHAHYFDTFFNKVPTFY